MAGAELADGSAPAADLSAGAARELAADEGEEGAGEAPSPLVALIDTGAPERANVVSRASVLGPAGEPEGSLPSGSPDATDGAARQADPSDGNGHGTAMLEAIVSENGDARVMSVKALGADGRGTAAAVYAAVTLAADSGARILNLSFAGYAVESNAAIAEAVVYAQQKGCEVVAAAGNSAMDAKRFTPAGLEGVFTAGAAAGDGSRQPASNYGESVDAYVYAGSTSYAAARAAGWLSANYADGWRAALLGSALCSPAALAEAGKLAAAEQAEAGEAADEGGVAAAAAVKTYSVGESNPEQELTYAGGYYTINIATDGYYWLEAWGGDGGTARGGGGGHSWGRAELHAGDSIRVNVGGAGISNDGITSNFKGGWEHGGRGMSIQGNRGKIAIGSGGGATYFSTGPALASNAYVTNAGNREKYFLLVAGGGGGGVVRLSDDWSGPYGFGGGGGGSRGADGVPFSSDEETGKGGAQSTGGAAGSVARNHSTVLQTNVHVNGHAGEGGGAGNVGAFLDLTGGGQGLFGGGAGDGGEGAGGGSGYVNPSLIADGGTEQGRNGWESDPEDGRATIRLEKVTGRYAVTLNKNGGSGGAASVTATYGEAMPEAEVPTRKGYEFLGYFDTKGTEGGTQYYNADGSSAHDWDKTKATTLYARWTVDYYWLDVVENGELNHATVDVYIGGELVAAGANDYYQLQPYGTSFKFVVTAEAGYKVTAASWNTTEITGGTKSGAGTSAMTVSGKVGVPVSDSCNVDFAVEALTYVATLNRNGGTGGATSVTATYGQAMPAAEMPTRAHYAFEGYYDTGGTQYYRADGSSSRDWDKAAAATLYARWAGETHVVALDRNGGSGGTARVTATYGSAMPAITAPSRAGYDFAGYYTTASGGTKYYDADGSGARACDLTADTTLYAHWTVAASAVTLDAAGGTGGTSGVTATYGQAMPAATMPSRTGYGFLGYYDTAAASGGTQYYASDGSSARSWDKTGGQTLYARWEAVSCEVTLDANGGEGGTAGVTAVYGQAMPALGSLPAREGHSFQGYYDAASGGTRYYTERGASAHAWDKAGDATLYARWSANSYEVALDAMGGAGGAGSVTATYGSAMPAISSLPSRGDGQLMGFWDDPWGGTQYYDANGASAKSWDRSSGATLYARWSGVACTVDLDDNGGSGGPGSVSAVAGQAMPALPSLPKRTGYGFLGYYDAATGGSRYYDENGAGTGIWDRYEGATLYAHWSGSTVQVTLDRTGGSGGTVSVTATYGSALPRVTKPAWGSYGFLGYWDAPVGGKQWYDSGGAGTATWSGTEDATLYARWSGVPRTVALDPNGGAGGQSSVSAVSDRDMPALASLPAREGYRFAGYYNTAKATGGVQYYDADGTGTQAWNSNEAGTLYARWEWLYTVTFDPNGGTGGPGPAEGVEGEALPAGVAAPAREGYEFAGYYTTATGGTRWYTADGAVSGTRRFTKDMTLYAHWTAVKCAVTLDRNGATSGSTKVTATYGNKMPSITKPSRTGYTFKGYFDEDGAQYYTSSGASARVWDKAAEATLTARWSANTYKVTLDRNGGSGGSASVTAAYGSDMPAMEAPERAGYAFAGYYTDKTKASAVLYYDADGTSARAWDKASATTLYARWTALSYGVALDANGGEGGTESVTATSGSAMPTPITLPTRAGYTFAGYYDTDADSGGTMYYKATGASNRSWNKAADATLWARWEPKSYNVTLNRNGGEGGTASVSATYTQTMPTVTVPTRSGYVFDGYYDTASADGGTMYYDRCGFGTRAWETIGAGTLYARWADGVGKIQFRSGGQVVEVADVREGASIFVVPDLAEEADAVGPGTEYGWAFAGWAAGTGLDSAADLFGTGDVVALGASDVTTLYAVYEQTLSFIGFAEGADQPSELGTAVRLRYNETNTSSKCSTPTTPQLAASAAWGWEPLGYTISATAKGNSWSIGERVHSLSEWTQTGRDGKVPIYAYYSRSAGTVRYSSGGGAGSTPDSTATQVFCAGSAKALSTGSLTLAECCFSREGHVFAGWHLEGSDELLAPGTAVATSAEVAEMSGTAWASAPAVLEYHAAWREAGEANEYAYSGSAESVELGPGTYLLEAWGAQGGYRADESKGGLGGYSRGFITLSEKATAYVRAGGSGRSAFSEEDYATSTGRVEEGGFNGGGYRYGFAGGGGASDVRIGEDSPYARVLVAGGGGSDGSYKNAGGYGGGESGGISTEGNSSARYGGYGGTQAYSGYNESYTVATQATSGLDANTVAYYGGGFGFGGGGVYLYNDYGGAGGGGWYGGSGSTGYVLYRDGKGGGGGSGYVFTEATAASYPDGCLLTETHFLANARTVGGDTAFAAPDGASEAGHAGDGYVRITPVRSGEVDYRITATVTFVDGDYVMGAQEIERPGEATQLKALSQLDAAGRPDASEGWTLAGWAASPGTGEVAYAPGGPITTSVDVTLHAVWSREVSYWDARDGSAVAAGAPATPQLSYGGEARAVALPAAPAASGGLAFSGWYTEAEGGERAGGAGDAYLPGASPALYAQWKAGTYTVRLHRGAAYTDQEVERGKSVALEAYALDGSTTPSSERGWTFDGWASAPGTVEVAYTNGQAVTDLAEAGGLVDLYAVCSREVTFTYRAAGTWATASATQHYRNLTGLRAGVTGVERPALAGAGGWEARGWRASGSASVSSSTSTISAPYTTANAAYAPAAAAYPHHLAQYSREVSFLPDANGGAGEAAAGEPAEQWYTAGAPATTSPVAALPDGAGLSREGYTFAGWNTDPGGAGEAYHADDRASAPFPDTSWDGPETCTLYAAWLAAWRWAGGTAGTSVSYSAGAAAVPYSGGAQAVSLPAGEYLLEAWGAQGGYRTGAGYGGKGGYSKGTLTLAEDATVYVRAGGSGRSAFSGADYSASTGRVEAGGFNGGGYRYGRPGGGGASDVRVGTDSPYARVIVAGGGGSDGGVTKGGMYGGGESGGSSTANYAAYTNYCGKGGAQTYSGYGKSYTVTAQATSGLSGATDLASYGGGFGYGGGGVYRSSSGGYGGAGGGGWYGGSGTVPNSDSSYSDSRGGGGGSGYVWTEATAASYPEGGLLDPSHYLADASTTGGNAKFADPDGTSVTGHSGDGYVRITRLDVVTVTFKDGDAAMGAQEVEPRTATPLKALSELATAGCPSGDDGWSFAGWATEPGTEATAYDYAEHSTITTGDDVTLYAVWSREVSYEAGYDGGSVSPGSSATPQWWYDGEEQAVTLPTTADMEPSARCRRGRQRARWGRRRPAPGVVRAWCSVRGGGGR